MATLTTVKGANVTLKENVPSEKIDVTMNYANLRVLYDTYTVDAADEFGTDGLLRLFTIPKGARLINFEVSCPATGATGIFDVGWAASVEKLPGTSTPVEAADPNGILEQVDPGAAAVNQQRMPSTVPGFMKKFAAEVEVQADFTEATADAGTKTLEFVAIIAVD
jgi:hypothetical protein